MERHEELADHDRLKPTKKGIPLKRFKVGRTGLLETESSKTEFIRIWQTSHSILEVADRLGRSYDFVMKNANDLRNEGIYLKRYIRRRVHDLSIENRTRCPGLQKATL
jgi:hypothetical protein